MKKYMNPITLISALILFLVLISGCSKTEVYGEKLTGTAPTVTVQEVLGSPEKFEGKTVSLEGEIKEVCPSGCWFFVENENTELYVNIGPSGFAIPNKTGHKVKVEGEIKNHKGTMMLIGKGVEIK